MRPAGPPCIALALVAGLSLVPRAVQAQEPGSPRARAAADADVDRRLAFLETRLRRGQVAANRWWSVWLYGWSAATAVQAGMAIGATDRGFRIDSAVGAVGSAIGVLPFGIFAFPPRTAADELDALPETTPAERRRKLRAAERLLDESAEAEAFGRSWINHALGGVVSVGLGLVLAVGYQRVGSGVANIAGGVALSELQIWTLPTAAIEDQEAYARWMGRRNRRGAEPPRLTWSFVAQPGGLGVIGRF